MNILFMSELFYPHGGGAELATYLYAKLLSEKGFRAVVVTNRFGGDSEVSKSRNLIVYRLPLFKGTESVKYSILRRIDVLSSSFMKKLMKWADAVYVPRFWFSAIPLAKVHRKPVVTHIHDYIPICPLSNLYDASKDTICNLRDSVCSPRCIYVYEKTGQKSLNRILYSVLLNSTLRWYFHRIVGLSDAIVFVSKVQKNLVMVNHANLLSRIYVIPNPLPDASSVDAQGEDFGYFGGPSHMKGFHVLCKAAACINRTRYGPLRIHATKFCNFSEKLSGMLKGLGIFAYGKLRNDEYSELYSRIRTVIVPSVWMEPLPYVVTEAMISGKLVVASRIGGITEQVGGCKGAFLFSAGDYEQLAEKIIYVNSLSRETMVDLGMKNREWVMKKFNNEKIVADFISVLMEVSNGEHVRTNN